MRALCSVGPGISQIHNRSSTIRRRGSSAGNRFGSSIGYFRTPSVNSHAIRQSSPYVILPNSGFAGDRLAIAVTAVGSYRPTQCPIARCRYRSHSSHRSHGTPGKSQSHHRRQHNAKPLFPFLLIVRYPTILAYIRYICILQDPSLYSHYRFRNHISYIIILPISKKNCNPFAANSRILIAKFILKTNRIAMHFPSIQAIILLYPDFHIFPCIPR